MISLCIRRGDAYQGLAFLFWNLLRNDDGLFLLLDLHDLHHHLLRLLVVIGRFRLSLRQFGAGAIDRDRGRLHTLKWYLNHAANAF